MSNEPAPATPPEPNPPPSRLPAFKQGTTQQTGESKEGSGGLYSAIGTVALIAVGIGWGLWDARQEAQQQQPIVLPKVEPVVPKVPVFKAEQTRSLIKLTIARVATVQSQEEAASVRDQLISAEKLAKLAAPDLLPEVQQAQRDLAAREPNLPKLAKAKPIEDDEPDVPVAPPPRPVNR